MFCFVNDILGYACEAHNNPADFFLDVINGSSAAVNVTKINNNGGTLVIPLFKMSQIRLLSDISCKTCQKCQYEDFLAFLSS